MPERADLAMVIADLGAGGAQRVLMRAAEALTARGHRVAIVTLAGPERDFYRVPAGLLRLSGGGVGDSANPVTGFWRNAGRIRALRQALRATHAKTVLSFVTQSNILTIVASFGLGMRVVVSERNDPQRQRLPRLWRILRALLYPHADAVTINSREAIAALEAEAPGSRPIFLPNPPPDLHTMTEPGRARMLLNVGRLHHQKAQDVLLEAFARVAGHYSDLQLCIAGEGDERSALEALARRLCIADRIIFAGAVTDIDALYRTASIFVLPSRHEGTSNALLEAMGHGLPCVVTHASPGLRGLIEPEREGLVVPVDDAAALAQALARLLDSPDLRARLGAAAQEKVRSYASRGVMEIWESVLQLGAGAAGSGAV